MLTYKKVINPKLSKELLEALQEGEDVLSCKTESKSYHNVRKMIEDILNEDY